MGQAAQRLGRRVETHAPYLGALGHPGGGERDVPRPAVRVRDDDVDEVLGSQAVHEGPRRLVGDLQIGAQVGDLALGVLLQVEQCKGLAAGQLQGPQVLVTLPRQPRSDPADLPEELEALLVVHGIFGARRQSRRCLWYQS